MAFHRSAPASRETTDNPAGPAVQSDDELLQYIYERLGTAYHPVGTCRMGDPADPMTVVDSNLRVIGLDNILIADSSVMPEIVAGNTNAPTMMIADVAADRICPIECLRRQPIRSCS